MCRECLGAAVQHRIKASLSRAGRHIPARPITVAVGLSGRRCAGSAALLALLHRTAHPHRQGGSDGGRCGHGGFYGVVCAVHIAVGSSGRGESEEWAAQAARVAASVGVPLRVVRVCDEAEWRWVEEASGDSGAREEAAEIAVQRLLAREAAACGALVLATGETAVRTAGVVVADTARGRGSRVATRTSLVDSATFAGLTLVRPLRDTFVEDALAAALALCSAVPLAVDIPSSSSTSTTLTVASVCNDFVCTMMQSLPQTAHTVLGSASRLVPAPGARQCRFCLWCDLHLFARLFVCLIATNHC